MDSVISSLIVLLVKFILVFVRKVMRMIVVLVNLGKKQAVPPIKDPLLLMSATKLAEEIREGKVSCQNVLRSYITRIREVQPYINAVVQDRFTEAFEEARAADSIIASKVKTKEELAKEKPLLGVPVTVKMTINVKGMPSNAGSKLYENRKASEDADVVALLKDAGAIIIATTNTSEFTISIETDNPLYGRTNNPYNTSRTSGGSTGGEAALVAAAGSILGIGNDSGGSLRIPACFTGVYAHKPTNGVVPNSGTFPSYPRLIMEYVCFGPVCRYAEDLKLVMKVLTKEKSSDMKFDEPADFSKLKIYYVLNSGGSAFMPEQDDLILLYLMKAVNHFVTNYGTETKHLVSKPLKHATGTFLGTLILSDLQPLPDLITGSKQEISAKTEFIKYLFGRSKFGLNTLLIFFFGKIYFNNCLRRIPKIEKQRRKIEEEILSILDENSVIIVPTAPCRAFYHGEALAYTAYTGMTGIFNILGLPATQCTLGFCEGDLPAGVQVVAARGNDRLALAVTAEIEKEFGGWCSTYEVEI